MSEIEFKVLFRAVQTINENFCDKMEMKLSNYLATIYRCGNIIRIDLKPREVNNDKMAAI